MADTYASLKLTHAAALRAISAGMAKAIGIKQPQCITVVDEGGHSIAFVRMDGAKFVSIDSSHNKAVSAAASRAPTGPRGNSDMEIKLAVLTEWHPEKAKKFRLDELQIWLDWMRRHDLIPTGTGPKTSTGRLFA